MLSVPLPMWGTPLLWEVLLFSLIHWYFSCRNCLFSYLSFRITANLLFSSAYPHALTLSPVRYSLLPIFLLLLLSSPLICLSEFLTFDLVDNLLPVVEAPEQWFLTCPSIHLCMQASSLSPVMRAHHRSWTIPPSPGSPADMHRVYIQIIIENIEVKSEISWTCCY